MIRELIISLLIPVSIYGFDVTSNIADPIYLLSIGERAYLTNLLPIPIVKRLSKTAHEGMVVIWGCILMQGRLQAFNT